MGEAALRVFYWWLQSKHRFQIGDVKAGPIWLITLGHVNRWFYAKLSPFYRVTVLRDLDIFSKEQYVNAWARALAPFKDCISYYGSYRLDGVEEQLCDETWGFDFTVGKTKHIVVHGLRNTFSKTSYMPKLVFMTFAKFKKSSCLRCLELADLQLFRQDRIEEWLEDYDEHNDRLRKNRMYELEGEECKCIWKHLASNREILMMIAVHKDKLLKEGWSWNYDGKNLTLYEPNVCCECNLRECEGCNLTYSDELTLNFHFS